MEAKRIDVDIICKHLINGTIIPLKVRALGDDGTPKVFNIISYTDLSGNGTYTTSDGVYVTDETLFFECRIEVNGSMRGVRLYYRENQRNWFMTI